jgi:hypothetical protein
MEQTVISGAGESRTLSSTYDGRAAVPVGPRREWTVTQRSDIVLRVAAVGDRLVSEALLAHSTDDDGVATNEL